MPSPYSYRMLRKVQRMRVGGLCRGCLPRCGVVACYSSDALFGNSHREWEIPRVMDLVLVRHGESEGNVAFNLSRSGDHSLYSGEFMHRHSSQWRLTDRGREQALIAGRYLRENIAPEDGHINIFDRHYVSEYLRAQETAARLELPNARWFSEVFLRERDWGQMDLMSWQERVEKMGSELKRRDLDRFLFAPPGGESMADVAFRTNSVLSQIHRECADRRVIIVCHGEVMWAMRTRLERMNLNRYRDLSASRRITDHIHNGQIMWYTRRDPDTGKISPFFTHMKSVCPWNMAQSINSWVRIERAMYTNGMLLAAAEQTPRMINPTEKAKPVPKEDVDSDEEDVEVASEASKAESADSQTSMSLEQFYINTADPQKPKYEPGHALQLRKAIIVDKRTRYEIEKDHYNAEGEVLMRELTLRGLNYDNIRRSSEAHQMARDNIVRSLQKHNIDVTIVKAIHLKKEDLAGMDVVFTAGGDGTFLKAASFTDFGTPIIGVNTDPSMSQGSLCCCHLDMTGDRNPAFEKMIRRLEKGKFKWLHHDRLVVTVVNPEGEEKVLPYLVLNEIALTVKDPAKPSVLDIGVDDLEREKVRCSGIIVCTGTGSTAWYDSIKRVHTDTAEEVLKSSGLDYTPEHVSTAVSTLAKSVHFPQDSGMMGYAIREPITNKVLGSKRRVGQAKNVSIKSFVWGGMAYIDGVSEFGFNYGTQAVIRVGPPNTRLSSVWFDNLPKANGN